MDRHPARREGGAHLRVDVARRRPGDALGLELHPRQLPQVRLRVVRLTRPETGVATTWHRSQQADDHLYLVSAAVGEQKDRELIEAHWPVGADAELRVVSQDLGVITLAGPLSRRSWNGARTSTSPTGRSAGCGPGRSWSQASQRAPCESASSVNSAGSSTSASTDLGTVYDASWDAGRGSRRRRHRQPRTRLASNGVSGT